jgi:integrase
MARLRRNRYGHLYLEYELDGRRCHEYTDLPDTPENRSTLAPRLGEVLAFKTRGAQDGSPLPGGLLGATAAPVGSLGNSPVWEFEQYGRTWVAENFLEWKPSVRIEFKGTLEKHLIPRFKSRDVTTITDSEIKQFRNELAKLTGRKGKTLSHKRINNILVVLRLIVTDACTRAGVRNPFATIRRLKVPKTDIRPLTLEELQRFLAGVRTDYSHYYIIRFFTGMRPGEVDGLKWEDVDWGTKTLRVRRTRQRNGENDPKTEESLRDIDMLPPVEAALRAQQVLTEGKSAYVFCTKNGTPRDHNLITRRVWYPTLQRLGIAPRTPYQSRHTFATLMLAAGENPEWIAKQLGHTDTTLLFTVYSRFVPNLTRKDGTAVMQILTKHGVLPGTAAGGDTPQGGA